MGLPSIEITFRTRAADAVARSQKGVVALIVRDSKSNGPLVLTRAEQIPTTIGKGNQEYIARAFLGYVSPPRKVLVYILPAAATEFTDALVWLSTQVFDYLAGPPDTTEAECGTLVSWIKGRRLNDYAICKAVLPGAAADSEAIVNFTAEDIKVGGTALPAGQYASRIAGLIAGTPMTISCTYAPLAEVGDVKRMTREEMDAAVDAGKFILFHDGEKVKTGRGVNSLMTTTAEKGAAFKKIKIVEALDMIQNDIRMTAQDTYVGKYANSYDNKCLLIIAIKEYLSAMERDGILRAGSSTVGIDMARQESYLRGQGVDTTKLTEQAIKEADTGSHVFLASTLKVLDAIEDIALDITI